jgi:hypothetical protein
VRQREDLVKAFYYVGIQRVGESDFDPPPSAGTVVELEHNHKYYRVAEVILVVGNGSFYKVILTDQPQQATEPATAPNAELGVYVPMSSAGLNKQAVDL